MKNGLKILGFSLLVAFFSLEAEASTSTHKSPDYTIRKDSLSTTAIVDTNKKTVIFPNPFNVFIINDEKNKP